MSWAMVVTVPPTSQMQQDHEDEFAKEMNNATNYVLFPMSVDRYLCYQGRASHTQQAIDLSTVFGHKLDIETVLKLSKFFAV